MRLGWFGLAWIRLEMLFLFDCLAENVFVCTRRSKNSKLQRNLQYKEICNALDSFENIFVCLAGARACKYVCPLNLFENALFVRLN